MRAVVYVSQKQQMTVEMVWNGYKGLTKGVIFENFRVSKRSLSATSGLRSERKTPSGTTWRGMQGAKTTC